MSVSEEWEEMHLTPDGWVAGSYQHVPGPVVTRAAPANEVLTVRRHVTATYGGPSRAVEDRTPRTDRLEVLEQLLDRYGSPAFSV
ncbi:translation initiation factor 1 [Cupriavidus sp. 30B13]|uniref:translation initiation factor 1 n=1 Tax=Cupriavidus sp. 30B13 TaxID=3384241 RepID=UPI003B915733